MSNDTNFRPYIVEALTKNDEPLSATRISQECGFSRKNKFVSAELEDMYEEGLLLASDTTGFVAYSLVPPADLPNVKITKDMSDDETTNATDIYKHEDEYGDFIPVSTTDFVENSRGWTIEEQSRGFKITRPSGLVYNVSKTQRLLVINDDTVYQLYDPEDVLAAIADYCESNYIQNYVLFDMSVGRSVRPESININPVLIFVGVERHNKAG